MTKRMLIDASHPEETRVVVLDGTRLEAFDIESANRMPLKGNIYLARVVRVEPSLQAAFVEYGGNRHGFLAFGEIHPDYYQLPMADRQRLIEMQQAEAREEEEAEQAEDAARDGDEALSGALDSAATEANSLETAEAVAEAPPEAPPEAMALSMASEAIAAEPEAIATLQADAAEATVPHEGVALPEDGLPTAGPLEEAAGAAGGVEDDAEAGPTAAGVFDAPSRGDDEVESVGNADAPAPETVGGSTEDDARERRMPPRFMRHYKIQEVIKRRQIMLIQVVKEERGGKGAALTTYISLAGRFSVLMPNSPRGGGVSRKITSAGDRKRLRDIIDEQGLPPGMSLIVRTAGAARPKPEIKRDCEYLLRLWDGIRERTFASTAPALIYEEADLIKRSIRDNYGRDVDEVLVDGEDAYREAQDFMRMLMPSHASKVRPVSDGVPLFARHGVDAQLDAMHSPTVQLKSGGYIVINQTEALVAIDVNSGRATRDRHIEDTALRTNLEAADEVARQLRLRDLAGLIVIDFIDMEASRNDAAVERRLKDALKNDRARIQVGRISHFGLLEMSRQRLRPSVVEHAYVACPACQGRGLVRGVESSGLQVLRAVEEEGAKRRAAEIVVHVATPVMLWLLNRKRERLSQIEQRFGLCVLVQPDDTLLPPALRIERTRAANPDAVADRPSALRMDYAPEADSGDDLAEPEAIEPEPEAEAPARNRERPPRGPREGGRGGPREGGRGGPREDGRGGPREGGRDRPREAAREPAGEPLPTEAREEIPNDPEAAEIGGELPGESPADASRRRRRRRRRGGRRDGIEGGSPDGMPAAEDEAGQATPGEALSGEASPDAAEGAAPMMAAAPLPAEAPDPTDPDAEEDEESRRRRRGRRGGRRRREETDAAAPEAAAPAQPPRAPAPVQAMPVQAAPVQAAPAPRRSATPADPFAGHLDDIFSAMEAAEQAAEQAASNRRSAAAQAAAQPAPGPSMDPAPPDAVAPDAVAADAVAADADLAGSSLSERPAPPSAAELPALPAAEPTPATAAREPVAAPAVAPIVLGEATAADLPRKRGWWRG